MKPLTLLLALSVVAALTSCSTAYKTGQTPDDVYYSTARPQEDEVRDETKDEERTYTYNDEYYDDRYLRMKVHNRYRWSDLNDWYYYDKYSYTSFYYWGSYNNPYTSWNYYYNPYCCCHNSYFAVGNYKAYTPPVVKRNFNLAGYTNTSYNNINSRTGTYKTPPVRITTRVYNNSNSLSDKIRNITNNDNSGNGSTRTYSPSNNNTGSGNSGSSGNGGKSGSSGTVTRPVRN
jgi:hypothetical protein